MATGPDALLDGLALDGAPVERVGDQLRAAGRLVGRVHPDERRLAWDLPLDRRLRARVDVERRLFDARAVRQPRRAPREPARDPAAWLDLRDRPNPALRALLPRDLGLDGARVLELGGSGEATRGFVRAGARRVDQLDVSPGMHALARARLAPAERERIVQHTAPAERLPFADGTFDLVYARHCVHHMHRPDALREAARVLKPRGWMLLIEPYLPAPLRPLMWARRRLRGIERGTDDPLALWDLALVRRHFADVRFRGAPSPATLVRRLPRLAVPLTRLERAGRIPPPLLHLVGGRVLVVARRPAPRG
jgi:SAM-dependent methyltransferase